MADYPPGDADAFARWLERQGAEKHHARQQQRREEDEHYGRAFSEEQPKPNGQYSNGQSQHIPKVEPLDTVRASSWHGTERPTRVWLDGRNLFRVGYVSILTGGGAVGKTLVALQACVSCVTGTPWLAAPIKQGPVIFYSAEEPLEEMHIRLDEICEAENLHLNALHDLHVIDLNKVINAALIMQSDDKKIASAKLTDLFHRLDATMTAIKPICLWLDNRSFIVIGNENDRNLAAYAMRQLQLLAEKHNCAIILLAHPSNAGANDNTGASGSTAWFNTARSVVYMTKPKEEKDDAPVDKNVRMLTNNKPNYSEPDKMVNLLWQFSRFICTDPPVRADENVGKHDKAERVFLKLLRLLVSQNRGNHLSPYPKSGSSYVANVFGAHKDREGLSPKWFRMAMDNLIDRKVIEIADRGPTSKKVQFIREVTHG